ncbi:MAG: nucleotidyltransferase domain-containing protein [Candidatus Nanohaloarchaea archaeon]
MPLASQEEIENFADHVRAEFGERLEEVILYGSYARDDHVPGSDIDIAILVNGKKKDDREKMFDIADKFREEKNLKFSPRVFEKKEFKKKAENDWSFHSNVEKEGVEI